MAAEAAAAWAAVAVPAEWAADPAGPEDDPAEWVDTPAVIMEDPWAGTERLPLRLPGAEAAPTTVMAAVWAAWCP